MAMRGSALEVFEGPRPDRWIVSPRVGISKAVEWLLRYRALV
jgi:hypothetical protein